MPGEAAPIVCARLPAPPLDLTRKSGVYRLTRPSCSNRIVTGCDVISAPGSSNRVSVTKSRSSALSCSTQPVDAGRKPVTCDRLLSGMRRKPNSIQSEHQFAFTAHLMADSQLRHNIRTPKQRKRLGNPKPPIRELRSTDSSNLDKAAAHQSLTFTLFREAPRRFRLCRI